MLLRHLQEARSQCLLSYICNLTGTEHEFPEDDAIASKHAGEV
jgi:hypothetical protein